MNERPEQKPIAFDNVLAEHPLFPYAQAAFDSIDRRFPMGSGERGFSIPDLMDPNIYQTCLRNLNVFYAFSTSEVTTYTHFVALIRELSSGNADIFTSYIIGHLRNTYSDKKSYFKYVHIQQTVTPFVGKPFDKSHALLLISATPIATIEEMLQNRHALLCDLSSRDIYLANTFATRQAEHKAVMTAMLFKRPPEEGSDCISLLEFDPLNGSPVLMSHAEWEPFYQNMEWMARLSPPAAAIPLLSQRNVFTHGTRLNARKNWESKNSTIIGYLLSDDGQNYHQIRRVNNKTQFGYWDPNTDTLVLLKNIHTREHGAYYYGDTRLPQHQPTINSKETASPSLTA